MHYIIFPKQDAWVYSKYPTTNYGLDEILEVRKEVAGITLYTSRILIQFDTSSFSTAALVSASNFYLNLYAANPLNLASDYTIQIYPISQSWTPGIGFPASSHVKTKDVSWVSKSNSSMWTNAGVDYIASPNASQTFNYNVPDIRVDVTPIVRAWYSGTLPNYGFLIKHSDAEETSPLNYGRLTFYSMDTHTVNVPTLEAVWDDSIFITGSAQMIYSGDVNGQLVSGILAGTFESASGTTTAGAGAITASFFGTAIHFVTESLSSSLSQSFNTFVNGNFLGDFLGIISGSISGSSVNTLIITASVFTGSINGSGSLSGSYTGSIISGSVSGSIISTGSAYVFMSGSIDLYVNGSFSGSFVGTSNANQYYFEVVPISGSSTQSGSVTGSYSGTGNISFSNARLDMSGKVPALPLISPPGTPVTMTGSFINTLAGTTFQALASDQIAIVMKNLKKEYKYTSTSRIRFVGKDQYQRKTFLNTAATQFSVIKYLPKDNTFYSIVDAYTGRVIIPFSPYTKVSCDLDGNYFDVSFTGFMPERFYRIIFKVTFDGADSYFDNNYTFKVVK